MSARSAIVRLLQSKDSRALALVGSWGRGKTHLWHDLVKSTPDQARSMYSYVSLFGMSSLDDLKLAIFQREIDASPATPEKSWINKLASKLPWRGAADAVTQFDYPYVGSLNALYRTVSFSRVRNRLICFDDLERKAQGLGLDQVLGLITFLCEERGCAVVLILNDTTMDGAADWNKYREKVFHGEVRYCPTTTECIDIIFGHSGDNDWYNGARTVLTQLDVSNMRIMDRIKHALEELSETFKGISPETKEQIGEKLALYSYCHNASGEGAPPIDRALRNPYHRISTAANQQDVRTDDEKRWDAMLSKVDFYPDELDQVVVRFVVDGFPDIAAFTEQVNRLEAARLKDSAENAFSDAWNAYNGSFEDNWQEIVQKFRDSFPAAAPTMHAMNANSSIALMRRMGEDELAESFIRSWIEPRRGERRHELSLTEAETFGRLTDVGFTTALREAERQEATAPDLADAMQTLARGHGSLNDSLQTIALAHVDDVVKWMEANPGRLTRTFITTSMQYPGDGHVAEAQALIRKALEALGGKSKINAMRVESIMRALADP